MTLQVAREDCLNMRMATFSFLLICILLVACSERAINGEMLELRKGIAFVKGSDEPFSGKAIYRKRTGDVSRTVEYKDGLRHGRYSELWGGEWNNQEDCRFNYKRGMLHGAIRHWNEIGILQFKGSCDKGRPHGTCISYYDNGVKHGRVTYDHGVFVGELVLWYQSGQKRAKVSIDPDTQTGTYSFWKEDGTLEASGRAADGMLVDSPDEKRIEDLEGRGYFHPRY
jgi:antitoxin component YwqK of YwqJK toxin-antitoxin module